MLPLKFPNEADKIYAESAAFRALSPALRFQAMIDLIASGERFLANSPRRTEAQALREADEDQWRRKHKELFARHGV